jgi:hypothetical protein
MPKPERRVPDRTKAFGDKEMGMRNAESEARELRSKGG